jgi:dienelactone hydrolase
MLACCWITGILAPSIAHAQQNSAQKTSASSASGDVTANVEPMQIFDRSNLVAWCIVPFDAKQRGPAERAEMVRELGLQRVAYDWRDEHVSSFEEEILQYKEHGIEFFAFWSWHDAFEPLIRKHGITPQIWVIPSSPQADTETARVAAAAEQLLPLVEKTRSLGLKLGLYNHGGWSGTPTNLIAVCEYLRSHHQAEHVGIVYNFHHAHDDLADFTAQFPKLMPYLLCLNLNGMADPSTVSGLTNKILPIGSGQHEQSMMQLVVDHGYSGPIGILDHRSEVDARESLQQNLDGLTRVVSQLRVPAAVGEQPLPADPRRGELINLNGYFPFHPVADAEQWEKRRQQIRQRILVSQGLWPMPSRAELNAVIHGRVERDDYVVDRVYFESIPGHYVTGSLYRPKGKRGPFPAIISPHGHWDQGRFHDAGEAAVKREIETGGETDPIGGRHPLQARSVQLARMGCVVLLYDMTGNADSIQIGHRPAKWSHLDTPTNWGFMSVQADLRLQNMMGLQTWNSIRALDFMLQLEDVDPARIGVTGASGGGTQSMLISAIDDRIAAAMPCVMVSTAMQGGCTCENAPLLRIDQGNIDIAAATAPRPLGMTAADDWTIELQTKGYPDLVRLYQLLGHPDRLSAAFHIQFPHNYNLVNRQEMYAFFNRHFKLAFDKPVVERPYTPLTRDEATVWDGDHPAPSGDQVGDAHEIRLLKLATEDSDQQMQAIVAATNDLTQFQSAVAGGWETILGRRLDQVGDVQWIASHAAGDSTDAISSGKLLRASDGEQVSVRVFSPGKPGTPSRGTVVLLTDQGLAAFDGDQWAARSTQQLTEAGYRVIAADLFQQDDPNMKAQPMWFQPDGDEGWKRFSGYTYGYNHCLFVKRVHDVLSILAYAGKDSEEPLHLVGIGSVAGPLAIAARSQSGDRVGKTVVDVQGFRFQRVAAHDDPMFVPGSVKYLDVDGLLAVCAPADLRLVGKETFPVADKIYTAMGKSNSLTRSPDSENLIRLIEVP